LHFAQIAIRKLCFSAAILTIFVVLYYF